MHKHEYCSSSWKMCLLPRLDCPELGTHKVEVCDWNMPQTDPDWDSWTFGKLNSLSTDPMPTLFWLFCRFSIIYLPKHWICLGYDKSWWQYGFRHHWRIFHTSMHRLRECVPPCLLIYETTVVLSIEIMTQEWWIYFKALSVQNERPLFPTCWYGAWIGLPTSDHERIDSSVPDELPNRNDWHLYKGMFWGLEGEWTSLQIYWCSSTISKGIRSYC